MPDNCESTWKRERFEIVGYGRRFGTSPHGGSASGWHLGSVSYGSAATAADLGCSAEWSAVASAS